jgi:hypothetical protein
MVELEENQTRSSSAGVEIGFGKRKKDRHRLVWTRNKPRTKKIHQEET